MTRSARFWWLKEPVSDDWKSLFQMTERACFWWLKQPVSDDWNSLFVMTKRACFWWLKELVCDDWKSLFLMTETACFWWLKESVSGDLKSLFLITKTACLLKQSVSAPTHTGSFNFICSKFLQIFNGGMCESEFYLYYISFRPDVTLRGWLGVNRLSHHN